MPENTAIEVALDAETISYLAEQSEAIKNAQISMTASVQMFIRRQKLEGQWRLNPDGKGISRQDLAAAQPEFTKSSRKR